MKFGIAINDLRANAIIGILPTERTKAQKIAVDLEAVYEIVRAESLESVDCHDSTRCVESRNDEWDDLCDSTRDSCESIVDYGILREIILDSFKQNKFFYLESALVAIQRAILERFPQILELDLNVKKLEIFSDCIPKVRLSWQKGEKLQGLDCFGNSCESPRNDGNGNIK